MLRRPCVPSASRVATWTAGSDMPRTPILPGFDPASIRARILADIIRRAARPSNAMKG